MPPLPSAPNTLKIDHHFTIGSDATALVRWHYGWSGTTPSSATLTTFATAAYNDFLTEFAGYYHTDTVFTSIYLEDLSSPTGASGTAAGVGTGTRAGEALPAGACVLQNDTIARRYRGGKGRSYWPFGVAGDLQTRQTWSSAFLANIAASYAAYVADLNALSSGGTSLTGPVNVSYYHGFTAVTNPITGRTRDVPTPRAAPIIDAITSTAFNTNVGSQRRRNLIRHG